MNDFKWNNTDQFSVLGFLLATFIPSGVGFLGFRFILPRVVSQGTPILLGYGVIGSIMLGVFVVVAVLLLRKESKQLGSSFLQRALLIGLKRKEVLITVLLILGIMILTVLSKPLSLVFMNLIDFDVPSYLPFFLDPSINPATADPMVVSSGVELAGRWDIFGALALMIILNIATEELYFRGWILPKLERFGRISWILNGLFFALYHTFQLWLLPTILLASLGFAFITKRSQSILPALIAHLVVNLLGVASLVPLFLG